MAQRNLDRFDAPKLEALVETMILAAHADGEFTEEERQHLLVSVQTLTDRRLTGEALRTLLARVESDLSTHGRTARLASLKEALADDATRAIALELAVAVMASDGVLRTAERELVMEAAEALGIDSDAAADIVARHHP